MRSVTLIAAGGRAPILVLQGDDDRVAPAADSGLALLAEYPDRVKLVSLPHAGDGLLPEQGPLIADAVVEFLRRHGSQLRPQ